MADLGGFDASKVDPKVPLGPLPAGRYTAVVRESENKATKAGGGSYLELKFEITEGPFKGRFVWARLNLKNPSDKAVEIAKAELSALCRAAGVLRPGDSSALHGKPLILVVGLKKRDDTGELANEVRGYEKLGTTGATAAATEDDGVPI